jgi:hypothetical protein
MATVSNLVDRMDVLLGKVQHAAMGAVALHATAPDLGSNEELEIIVADVNKLIQRVDDHSRMMLALIEHNT